MANGNGNNLPKPPQPPTRPTSGAEPVGLRVSLIPAEEAGVVDPRKGFKLFFTCTVIGVVVLALISGAVWGKVWLNRKTINNLEAQRAQVAAGEAAIAPAYAQARTVQNQLKGVKALLTGHKYATNVFAFLEAHTLPTVGFTTIALADDGKMTLTAEARDYQSLASQVVEFRAAREVATLALSGINALSGVGGVIEKVSFTLSVGLNATIFNRK